MAVYSNHRHSCFLYLTSVLVDEIGDNYSLDLQNLFRMLAEPTLDLLNQHDGLRIVISFSLDVVNIMCNVLTLSSQNLSFKAFAPSTFHLLSPT